MPNIADYSELWDSPPERFRLRKFLIGDKETFLITDEVKSQTWIIEDDDLSDRIVKRMMEAGVEVVDQTHLAE
ncbi:hypothetical protein [Streptomyces virginiae]|uniref:hypothetical protein n=1 Tax=Streptomyces virginiae TaxID=1961 RepID=UPI0030DFF500